MCVYVGVKWCFLPCVRLRWKVSGCGYVFAYIKIIVYIKLQIYNHHVVMYNETNL